MVRKNPTVVYSFVREGAAEAAAAAAAAEVTTDELDGAATALRKCCANLRRL